MSELGQSQSPALTTMPLTSPQTHVIRSASLNGYAELARSLDLNPQALMRKAGLSLRCLDDPETPVNVYAVQHLPRPASRPQGIEDFGLQLAHNRRMANLGPLSIVLREELTARAALDTLCRYLRLLNASLLTRIEDHADVVIIREEFLTERPGSIRQSIERAAGVMYRILVELPAPHGSPGRSAFRTGRPKTSLPTACSLAATSSSTAASTASSARPAT